MIRASPSSGGQSEDEDEEGEEDESVNEQTQDSAAEVENGAAEFDEFFDVSTAGQASAETLALPLKTGSSKKKRRIVEKSKNTSGAVDDDATTPLASRCRLKKLARR